MTLPTAEIMPTITVRAAALPARLGNIALPRLAQDCRRISILRFCHLCCCR